ncbi:MAG: cytochrome c3 family protein [Deferrisomatales bacterium]
MDAVARRSGVKGRALWGLAALLAASAVGWGPVVVAQERLAGPAPVEYRDVAGRVVDAATGQPLAGVPVSLLHEVALTDESGGFRFEKIPLIHSAEVSLRVQNKNGVIIGCITVDVPVRFYPVAAAAEGKVAVVIADPLSSSPVELRLAPVGPDRIDDFCGVCHEPNPCLETATYDEVVRVSKDLRGIIVREEEVEAYKKKLFEQGLQKDLYRKMRYQDTHPGGMNMEVIPTLHLVQYQGKFRKPESLVLREGRFATCDTCHTRHLPTDQRHYVVLPFERENTLCFECHR